MIVNPANDAAADAVMLRAGKTIVFGVDGAYEKSAAVAFPAAGVSTAADNVTVVAEASADDDAFGKLADTDTPEPESPSPNTA